MSKYELVLVLPGNLEKEGLLSLLGDLKKITNTVDAKLLKEEDWGVKKLSYPIKKNQLGAYYFWQLELPLEKLKEMHQLLNFETRLLRYMLLKIPSDSRT